MPTRRQLLKTTLMTGAGVMLSPTLAAFGADTFESKRPAPSDRRFVSDAVEETIRATKPKIADSELAWMFENCYPNTLDTTVRYQESGGKPDTFVITGDIDAMWLRDSSAQVWPYLPLAARDQKLRRLLEGVIRRQARCILIDPYANAFQEDPAAPPPRGDQTDMKPGVRERKWELDSLCYPIRLAHGYWKHTGDTTPFDADWEAAMDRVLQTFREQQRKNGHGPYHFQRWNASPTETQFFGGYGWPVKPVGLIASLFRPSDDATIFPFLVPANFFAVAALRHLAELYSQALHQPAKAMPVAALADEVEGALHQYARQTLPGHGTMYAYEVNGLGSLNFMDDANVPSLLSLPYLGACAVNDPIYQATRRCVWGEANPFFFRGKYAGIGGPHVGLDMIWPMSILMLGLTSTSPAEVASCLRTLKATHAGTGFMHESFYKDDPSRYTRPWFAWANTLFGEFILHTLQTFPAVLQSDLSKVSV